MPVLDTIKTTVDPTPLYVVVGAGDLAAEKVRELGADLTARADKARTDLDERRTKLSAELSPASLQAKAGDFAEQAKTLPTVAIDRVKALPATAADQTATVTGLVAGGVEDLAARGKKLVERVRTQRSTQELVDQANITLSQAKGAVTTARTAADQVQRSAKATITTGRHQATKFADTVLASGEREAEVIKSEAADAVKNTRTAAKRTNTTAKRATKRTTTRAKATTTSARKTAATAKTAATKAAEKVGD